MDNFTKSGIDINQVIRYPKYEKFYCSLIVVSIELTICAIMIHIYDIVDVIESTTGSNCLLVNKCTTKVHCQTKISNRT